MSWVFSIEDRSFLLDLVNPQAFINFASRILEQEGVPLPLCYRHSLWPTDLDRGQERSATWVSQDVCDLRSHLANWNSKPCFTEFMKVKFLLFPLEQCLACINQVLYKHLLNGQPSKPSFLPVLHQRRPVRCEDK